MTLPGETEGKPASKRGVARQQIAPPLSLYVHFPWCLRKCPYCDFNSHAAGGDGIPEDRYVAALLDDLSAAAAHVPGRAVTSVFFGGGTPSLLSAAAVERLLQGFRDRIAFAPEVEITLEANPGTAEAARFAGYRDAGVTRLSLGIQSFDDALLQTLGRIHSAAEAHRAIELAQRHFDQVNLDLMYALPHQALAQARRDIETAIARGPAHLSAYHLTLEPNTAFHHAPPPLPDDDLAADMQDLIEATLTIAGFEHYETSAFAQPGKRCRHNLNYWTFGDYLGIGAGAHAKVTDAHGITREARLRHPKDYLAARDRIATRHTVTPDELPFEFMMNALRLTDGVPAELFVRRTGLPPETIAPTVAAAVADGLLADDPMQLKPTARGRRFLNVLLQRFLDLNPPDRA